MTGRRCLLPVKPDPKVAQFCAAPWTNFAPPLTTMANPAPVHTLGPAENGI